MNAVMTAVVLVVCAGFIASLLLVIASHVFYVPVDERVAEVREILPGANCGGCGFAGCDLCRSEERRVGKECRSRWSPYH